MDPRWWFYAICEWDRVRMHMQGDEYDAYLAGRSLDNHSEGVQ